MLEEILREIEEMEYPSEEVGRGLEEDEITDRYMAAGYGFCQARDCIGGIIRSHMEDDGWIPCSEGLPEESFDSVIGWDDYRSRACFVQYLDGRWILGDDTETVSIIAWQPLPLPYHPGKSVGEDYKQQIMSRFCKIN